MTARRQIVTLYPSHSMRELLTVETNLDYEDTSVLRSTLEDLVKRHRGTLELDLSQFRIRVRDVGPSTIRRWCGVTAAGRTVVKR